MSQWTHVNGAIRFDSVRMEGMPFNTLDAIKKLCGNTASFKDSSAAWDKCNVPSGSEGSIQFSFWANSSLTSTAAFGVHIFGDLRDFGSEDVHKIKEWFGRVTTTEHVMIRSAILEIRVEYGKTLILKYQDFEAKMGGEIIEIEQLKKV